MAKLRKGSRVRKLKRGGSGTAEEEELEKFGKEYGVDTHGSMQKGGKTRKSKRKSNKKTRRKMNGFMKMMLDAKKHNKSSFVYNGKKYKQGKTKTGLVIYKKG
jgi:hypothetical protein